MDVPSSSSSSQDTAAAPVLQQQSKRHRKRIIPPGPAGLWFQQQQQQPPEQPQQQQQPNSVITTHSKRRSNRSTTTTQQAQEEEEDDDDDDDEETLTMRAALDISIHHPTSSSISSRQPANYSPAWTAAHIALGFVTPAATVPSLLVASSSASNSTSHLTSSSSRNDPYDRLRPHVPSEYSLLREIINDDDDTTAASGSGRPHNNAHQKKRGKRLLLLLQIGSIQSMTANDHLWSAVLSDETTVDTITAWIQPSLVRSEQQQGHHGHLLRPGNVLLLQGCGRHVVQHQERLLLIARENIIRCFTPSDTDQLPHATYIQWMETRQQLTLQVRLQSLRHRRRRCDNDSDDDDDADDDEAAPEEQENDDNDDQGQDKQSRDPFAHLSQLPFVTTKAPATAAVRNEDEEEESRPRPRNDPTTNRHHLQVAGHSQQQQQCDQSPRPQEKGPVVVGHQLDRLSSPPASVAHPPIRHGQQPQPQSLPTTFVSSSPLASSGDRQQPKKQQQQPISSVGVDFSRHQQSPAPAPTDRQQQQHPSQQPEQQQQQQHRTPGSKFAKQRQPPPHQTPSSATTTTTPTRKKRLRSIFPRGCRHLMTQAAWEEMQQFMDVTEYQAVVVPTDPSLASSSSSPVFSNDFRNLCPTLFQPHSFAGMDHIVDDYFF
jgi:hypothetical protein